MLSWLVFIAESSILMDKLFAFLSYAYYKLTKYIDMNGKQIAFTPKRDNTIEDGVLAIGNEMQNVDSQCFIGGYYQNKKNIVF